MPENDSREKLRNIEKRIKYAHVFVLALFCISIIYLFLLQIVDIRHYKVRANNQRYSKNFIYRGQIVDRNGLRLASDQTSYNLYAHREYFDHKPSELAQILAPVIGISKANIEKTINRGSTVILLKKDIDRKTAEQIKKLGLRELSLDKKNDRVYGTAGDRARRQRRFSPDKRSRAGGSDASEKQIQNHHHAEQLFGGGNRRERGGRLRGADSAVDGYGGNYGVGSRR